VSQETAADAVRAQSARAGQAILSNDVSAAAAQSIVARLAGFFPQASPVRIPVEVVAGAVGSLGLSEKTVVEFGTPDEVLFASSLPLEFGDRLRIRNNDQSLDAEVNVVAVQYHGGRTAIAARFSQPVKNWIVKR
jgi:hypothetical protein